MSLIHNLAAAISKNVELLEAELNSGDDGKSLGKQDRVELFLHEAEPSVLEGAGYQPSTSAFQLLEKLRADIRGLEAAITPTKEKLAMVALSGVKAKALEAANELKLSDTIAEMGGEVELTQLAQTLSVHPNKLGAVMRVLAAEYIYTERRPGVFANSRHSIGLQNKNEGARDMLSLLTGESYTYAGSLYESMTRDGYSQSFESNMSAFSLHIKEKKAFVEYIMEPEKLHIAQKVVLGVVPWLNKITRPGLLHDYPWGDLGAATVVDLGSGPGDVGLDLLRHYPQLRWTFQDLPSVVQGQWPELKEQLSSAGVRDRAELVSQDYFQDNASSGDVYFLRGVMREYDDRQALQILQGVLAAMQGRPHTRLLINEIICASPAIVGDASSRQPISELLPSQQSAQVELANAMALNAQINFGGKERSWPEMKLLLHTAGFAVERFFQFKTFTTMIECKVAGV
ncbi:S-adenosyl-L-methionine-dependent methyltransferase [Ilyonectria destructans]|nr:S-adenosyl-L-methionine-dependent methyltransferase [Ilyonectria destructans]